MSIGYIIDHDFIIYRYDSEIKANTYTIQFVDFNKNLQSSTWYEINKLIISYTLYKYDINLPNSISLNLLVESYNKKVSL
jgi:hypothetical protein